MPATALPLATASRRLPLLVPLLRQLRVAHWLKTGVVLLPAFFAGRLLTLAPGPVGQLALAAGSFCLLGSAIYALNDLLDMGQDRLHPTKRRRPACAPAVAGPAGSLPAGRAGAAGRVYAYHVSFPFK